MSSRDDTWDKQEEVMRKVLLRLLTALALGLVAAPLILTGVNQEKGFIRLMLIAAGFLYEPVTWLSQPPERGPRLNWVLRTVGLHWLATMLFLAVTALMTRAPLALALHAGVMSTLLLITFGAGLWRTVLGGSQRVRERLYWLGLPVCGWWLLGSFVSLGFRFGAPDHVHHLAGGFATLIHGGWSLFRVARDPLLRDAR